MSKARTPWIYGNMKRWGGERGGEEVEAVEFLEVDGFGGIGDSDVMERRVSAATMPPIEWPIRMV